jgi:hypothetical protein
MKALVILVLLAHAAHADDRTGAVKAMLEVQRKALLDGNDDAFKATFTSDAVVSLSGDKPDDAIQTWKGSLIMKKLAFGDVQIGWNGTWGWVAADVHRTSVLIAASVEAGSKPAPGTMHWVELVVADGKGVKGKVLWTAATIADKNLSAYNYAQELVPRASPPAIVAQLAKPAEAKLASDAATSVLGTSDGDRGLGVAAANKLVASWNKLAIEVVEPAKGQRYVDPKDYEPLVVTAGDATAAWASLRMKLPGKNEWIPIHGFVIARGSEIVAVAYSAN